MNKFVEEHTILMKGFLRSISTSLPPPNHHDFEPTTNGRYYYSNKPSTTSTPESSLPQTPMSSSRSSLNTNNDCDSSRLYNGHSGGHSHKKEIPFNSDLIDLGKQLSILHTILVNVLSGLDQVSCFTEMVVNPDNLFQNLFFL